MTRLRLAALIILTAIATISRAQSSDDNPLIGHLPADADKVVQINYTVLSGKVDWKALGDALAKKEDVRKFLNYLAGPAQVGILPRYGLFIAQTNVMKLDSPRYTTLLFALSDSTKLIKFIKEDNKPEKDGKLTIRPGKPRTAIQGKTVMAWNDKLMAITFIKAPLLSKGFLAQPKNPAVKPADAGVARYMPAAMRRTLAALKGPQTSIFITDPAFRAAVADDADAHVYSRLGGGFGMMADIMRITHAPVDPGLVSTFEKLKQYNMRSIGTIRFDNGAMSLRSRFFADSLADLDLGLRPINTGLIERLPQGNMLGMGAFHLDPVAYLNLLQRMGGGKAMHFLDSMLAKKDLSVKGILSAFKGDLVFAVIDDGKTIPATDSTPAKPGKPGFYVVLPIADRAAFDKLDDKLHLTRDSAAGAPADTTGKPKLHLAHTLRDDILVFGPSKQATDDFFNKPGRGPSRLETDEVRNSPFALAIDVKAIGDYLAPMMAGGSPKNQQAKILFDLFDQVVVTSGKLRSGEIETLFEIKMTDKQQNSLTTISKLIMAMSKQ